MTTTRSIAGARQPMVAAVAVTVSLVAALVAAACTRTPRDAKPPTDELAAIAYTDVAGQNRRITLEVRVPDHVDGSEVPVVVWSHGGSTGRRTPTHVGVGWGRVMNEAGVAFVAIAHPGRSDDVRVALCAATGAADCATFNPLMWDRPHDVVAVLDWVEANATRLGIDASRLVYGGHSAGIGIASAWGDWVGVALSAITVPGLLLLFCGGIDYALGRARRFHIVVDDGVLTISPGADKHRIALEGAKVRIDKASRLTAQANSTVRTVHWYLDVQRADGSSLQRSFPGWGTTTVHDDYVALERELRRRT